MQGKIINDPVYGFLRFSDPVLAKIIEHPFFQRLRRITQMGMAQLVYPGATHSRFLHSLGATHLMGIALRELRKKGIDITSQEKLGAKLAILLHDVGHGPFSHALEHTLIQISHEDISLALMQSLNQQFDGALEEALAIFAHQHPKPFLHQLVSSQLDMDRMDYLNRDSFFSGVTEGAIGHERLLQMITVKDEQLMIEEKGIYSVEKFIVARRLMYWQVYLHKTVLGAEKLIVKILERAKLLASRGEALFATPSLSFFLYESINKTDFLTRPEVITHFCAIDDADVMSSIKTWTQHSDDILRTLCQMLTYRHLYKVQLANHSDAQLFELLKKEGMKQGVLNEENLDYYLFEGTTSNSAYKKNDDNIKIAMKDGKVLDISQVDHPLIGGDVANEVKKHFICYIPQLRQFR